MSERYHPSPDQVALADTLGESIAALLPLARLQESREETAETWRSLADLGVFDIAASEADGGSGLGATEEALIVTRLGRQVVSPSVLATITAIPALAAAKGLPPTDTVRVAAGHRRDGRVVFVEDASARLLLVREGEGGAVFELPAAARVVDPGLWAVRLCEAGELTAPVALLTRAEHLRARLNDAAALAGIARAALDMAVEYAGMRTQFGRPIGSFQAVKHHCANMALSARCAADLVCFAAVALDDGRQDWELQVESALLVSAAAALDNCGANIQVHGGIGFSDEAAPHQLLKRARVLVAWAGGQEDALGRVEACAPTPELIARPRPC